MYYDKQTQDQTHLEQILSHLEITAGLKILDLGTGSGYLAFPAAQRYPNVTMIGLDVVEKTLKKNQERAAFQHLDNLTFVNYDGMVFPFEDSTFDMVITRYALHHFPAIQDTFHEINRVLKPGGKLFLSDPAPNDNDTQGFVDAYMQMKDDGHIRFYTKDDWKAIGESAQLQLVDGFDTSIRFPRKKETASGFDDIMKRYDTSIIEGYAVEVIDDEIWISEKVHNLLFYKP